MYIHLGQDTVILTQDIIGIFDLDNTTVSKKTRDFLKTSEKNSIVEYVSNEIPKSYIVCNSNGKTKVYISQISSQTLYKRAERIDGFGTEN